MARPKDPPQDDESLFREAVGPVRSLVHERVTPQRNPPPPFPLQTRMDREQTLRELLSDHFDPAELETGDELFFARPGVPRRILRRLRRGQYSIDSELDLHGMNVAVARDALTSFLHEAKRAENPCVRIIHGKGRGSPSGQPVLKRKLNHWLRQWDDVLAFSSARPIDGGTGAVYVLLKR